ncbi:Cell division control protein 25 [Ceratobasidium theobromae]|uniref:Cell division control protein 25 n=1 Tax=Ceratobasidium theobromae TaxID=1582974 RepID=A0A5N5QXI5_9AGAM|nr:Cell division control protein 25 [Ceratobasidium theobromae]
MADEQARGVDRVQHATMGEYVVALHDFEPVGGNTTCLSFRAGQEIRVLNRDSTGWWDGELDGRRGWFPSNYVKVSEEEGCPRVMVSLYHALLVLNTSVHASRVSHYQPSTACVISSVRTVLTATDCLHKTAPALARFPHLARARADVLQELGRLVAASKKASGDVEDARATDGMLRAGDAVFACCRRYVEVAVSCGVHVAGRERRDSASVDSLSSDEPEPIPSGHVPSAQLLSALRTTHDHLLSIIAAFIGHVHSHSRASHASSKGHLIKMTRETVDKVRQVLTIVCAVCDHPAVIGPERVALAAAKDALHAATSVLVEAVKRMLQPPTNREEEEKALAVQAATGTLRAGGDCVTAVRSCLTRRTGYDTDGLVFDIPAPPSVSDNRSMRSPTPSDTDSDPSEHADPDASVLVHPSSPSPLPSLLDSPSQPSEPAPDTPHSPDFDDDTESLMVEPSAESFHFALEPKSLPPVPQPADLLAVRSVHPHDVAYNTDGTLIGATLDALLEMMTAQDRTPDPKLTATFFISFRLFTTPLELVDVLHRRWDMRPPSDTYSPDEYDIWCRERLEPVRLRVYNFIKTWLDAHWQPSTDAVALAKLRDFVSSTAASMNPQAVQRLVDLLTQREPTAASDARLMAQANAMAARARSIERTRSKNSHAAAPTPVLSKSLFAQLRSAAYPSINVVDFDPLELARQFTIMESRLYSKILPEEILHVGLRSAAERGNSIRAMSTLSTAITGWVTETILDEPDTKKRTALLKLFIKIAGHCDDLNNFSTLRSILAALDSSTISRLSKTWIGLSTKNKARLENLRKLTDHTRNHYEYRARLRSVHGHAVPFLGLYLTDVTFCREGNSDNRVSPGDPSRTLLNFDKYRRLAAIAEDVQRFQVAYNLIEVPEVQKYLEFSFEKVKKSGNDLHDLYRRSLLVEPRQPADTLEQKAGTIKSSELFGWASRDRS